MFEISITRQALKWNPKEAEDDLETPGIETQSQN
jgi:hypothetical protein